MSGQKAVIHLHNGILLYHKKEETFTFCNSLDGPGYYYAKWNKPFRENDLPYDLTYMWNLIDKINWRTKHSQSHGSVEQTAICQSGGGWGVLNKRMEGISQRTSMHNPRIQTTVWWWPEGKEDGGTWVEVGKAGGNGNICNSVNNINKWMNTCKEWKRLGNIRIILCTTIRDWSRYFLPEDTW